MGLLVSWQMFDAITARFAIRRSGRSKAQFSSLSTPTVAESPYHFGAAGERKGAQAMAFVRKTLEQARREGRVDRAKLAATTEEDIRRHQIEDGYDPDAPLDGFEPVVLPQAVRKKLAMTQEEFARALRIPVATLRNWEQGRVRPDPAARSLLLAVYRNPKAVLAAIAA
jgi:putative transcriptional regulator